MKDKLLTVFTVILFVGGLSAVSWVFVKSLLLKKELTEVGETSCVKQTLHKTMRDESMEGLIDPGQPFQVLVGYYKCNPVHRLDLVYFRPSPPLDPVVKQVHGLPGDQFEVIATDQPQTYKLKINQEPVKTAGEEFFFTSKRTPPLKTFEIARRGVLGPNEFIVLSAVPPGLADSASLGIIKLTAFEGKAIKDL
jgi:hypothetical protein